MKKSIYTSFLGGVLCIATVLNAQVVEQSQEITFGKKRKIPRGQSVMVLKSRAVEFRKKDFTLELPKTRQSKKVYMKLKPPITKSLKRKLEAFGVKLDTYISDNTFVVELNENKLNKLRKMYSVYGFAEINPADKIAQNLYNGNISTHAKDGTYVKCVVTFYNDLPYNEVANWVKSVGGILLSGQLTRTHRVTISIHSLNIMHLAELDVVKYIDEIAPPQKTENINAGKLSNVFWDNDGGTISGLYDKDYTDNEGYYLKGYEIKVAVRDGGKIDSHPDFDTRLTIVDNDTLSGHATHVAGTIGGSLMFDNDAGGLASETLLYSYSFYVPNTSQPREQELNFLLDFTSAIETYGVSIINNSWSYLIGFEDGVFYAGSMSFGEYDGYSEDMDDFIYDYFDNDALILKSAGNHRADHRLGDPTDRDGTLESDGNYYDLIDPAGCAKNIVTVGAIGTDASDYESSDFSSWGPTDDGRVKPDVVADGFWLTSTVLNNGYDSMKGTSMSCPVVTGICALIHESYYSLHTDYPTADIVKALLCNFAEDLGNKGPDFAYGFGLVDARACIDAIEQRDNSNWSNLSTGWSNIVTETIEETDDYCEYQFTIPSAEADNEAVTLVWIDPPGSPSATNAIVNDLDLYVFRDAETYNPFYHKDYDETPAMEAEEPEVDPTQPARYGYNRYDTVEKVLIEPDNTGVIPAGTYTVHVTGFKVPTLDQHFAVVSSVGFNRFNFNSLKVKDREGNWISNTRGALVVDPDLLLKITDLGSGFDPSGISVQYQNSSDGGATWSTWTNASGLYADQPCTTLCSNPHSGVAYTKFNEVEFDNESATDNVIRFKLTYDSQTYYSRQYIVPHYNLYYVCTAGDDANGGTKENPMRTIQYAIDTAEATDIKPALIYVQGGTYYPPDIDNDSDNDSVFLRNYVFLYGGYDDNWSRDIDDNQTIIQGDASDGDSPVVIGANNAVIDGFYIQGGKSPIGGGIYLYETSPIIANCVIRNNQAAVLSLDDAYGAGIYADTSNAIIKNCEISDNSITVGSGDRMNGGGIYAVDSSLFIKNCLIKGNSLYSSSGTNAKGGGIHLVNDSSKLINCCITGNTAYSKYVWGGGLYLTSGTKILNCLIYENDCKKRIYDGYTKGDGIYCTSSDTEIINSFVYKNYGLLDSSGEGIYRTASPKIYNCIVWDHPTADIYSSSTVNVYNNCIQDTNFNGINGNISYDPQLRDAVNEDFRLKITSPCIDAGNDGAPSLSFISQDYYGQQRIFEFDNSGSESVDIGADEYVFGFAQQNGFTLDNDGFTITWESKSGTQYYVEYTEGDLDNDSFIWTTVDNDGVAGQTDSTSWTDDGTDISPPYDNDSVLQRFYRVFFDN